MADEVSRYCVECTYRKEREHFVRNKHGEMERDFTESPHVEIITNKGGFCGIGYTNNPKTEEATYNVIRNHGRICRFNPWYKKSENLRHFMLGKGKLVSR